MRRFSKSNNVWDMKHESIVYNRVSFCTFQSEISINFVHLFHLNRWNVARRAAKITIDEAFV